MDDAARCRRGDAGADLAQHRYDIARRQLALAAQDNGVNTSASLTGLHASLAIRLR